MQQPNKLHILKKLDIDERFNNDQLEKIQYSLLAIVGDLSKLLILLMIFRAFHFGLEFIYAYITTMLLRVNVGGKHFKSYSHCLIFSVLFFASIFCAAHYLSTYRMLSVTLSVLSGIILIVLTPQLPQNSKRVLKASPIRLKMTATIFVITYIVIYIKKSEPIFLIGPLTIIFQSIQLLLMKGENLYAKKTQSKIHLSDA